MNATLDSKRFVQLNHHFRFTFLILENCLFVALSSFDSSLTFNMDETMLTVNERRARVICPVVIKIPTTLEKVRERIHITLVFCIGAYDPDFDSSSDVLFR